MLFFKFFSHNQLCEKLFSPRPKGIICFGNLTPSQFETIREEHLNIDKDTFKKIRKICYNEPHDWMLINCETERIFKKFDEIIYEESEN